jgi:hypothetical protein
MSSVTYKLGSLALAAAALLGTPTPAHAADMEVAHFDRTVQNAGTFHVCDDGTVITFASTSQRRYTTWTRDGVLVRERRHLSFDGSLTAGGRVLPYTGVWNRDQDLLTDDLRITGGQFRVDLPSGGTLVGAGMRAEGTEFKGSGDRFLRDLCAAFDVDQ